MAGYIILALAVLFLAVTIIRALMFKPPVSEAREKAKHDFDRERAITSLQEMVKLKTISNNDEALMDAAEFEKFRALLVTLYPVFHEKAELSNIGRGGLLYCLKGQSSDAPTVYMAHYDVVPVDEETWQKPPFSGIRENGELWGRGTLDTKCTLCAALEATENLLKKGFTPKNDIYFSFAGDEEIAGNDAPDIVEELKRRGVKPALVLDEGGAVVDNVFPGVDKPTALIGTGEKGMLNVQFSYSGTGGHASAPPPHTAVGVLAKVVTRIENKPFKAHLAKPAAEMFDTLGRHSTFVYRLIFANLWCFFGVLNSICKKAGGELNALIRTTCAFTCMQGSKAFNVLPPNASVTANLRIMSPDTVESVIEYLKDTANNPDIKISQFNGGNPSPYADTKSEGYARVKAAVEQTWPQALVSPYLMVACSDSRHFCKISDTVLKFSAMALTKEDRQRIHGNDERITEERFYEAVEFYFNVISAS